MREIKFRGKDFSGVWHYGHFYIEAVEIDALGFEYVSFIKEVYGDHFKDYDVDPETVGQFTGLHDKNGREIYENDIVKADHHNPKNYRIEFLEGGFCGAWNNGEGFPIDINHFYDSTGCCIEVVGTFHENPELLK